jgi:hypothetical protein
VVTSPLDVRFSQWKVKHKFIDGRSLSEVIPQVKVVRNSDKEEAATGAPWRLEAPFPMIEVVRWRCKLRDPSSGRPKVDPKTGRPMFDPEVHRFTFDNRRLYCLQVAALKVYPERCVVEVLEVPAGPAENMRELRKFRTMDIGKTVMIGSRLDKVAFMRWSWKEAAGLEKDQDGARLAEAAEQRLAKREKAQQAQQAKHAQQVQQSSQEAETPTRGMQEGRNLLKLLQDGERERDAGQIVPQTAEEGAAKGAALLSLLKGRETASASDGSKQGQQLLSQIQGRRSKRSSG